MIYKTSYGSWRVRVKFRGVVVADQSFDRKGDALQWEASQKRLLIAGEFGPPAAGRVTVGEWRTRTGTPGKGRCRYGAWESDESALRVHIVPTFGKLPVSAVSATQVGQFLTHLATTRSVRTAARIRTTQRGLFRYAVRTRLIVKSPAEDVPRCGHLVWPRVGV